MSKRKRERLLSVLFLSILSAASSFGGVRHFTYLYEAPTSAPGSVELENTVTWARTTDSGLHLDDVGFREELEIGVTDHFQLGVYPLDWAHHGGNGNDGFSYDGGAIELIYNLSNPVVDPIGISLYEEISGGRQHFELESKLIAQKDFGPLRAAPFSFRAASNATRCHRSGITARRIGPGSSIAWRTARI
jgi:hypothetical protein